MTGIAPVNQDTSVRLAAFEWLESRQVEYGDVLPRQIIQKGFIHNRQRVPLLGPQGIFKPKIIPEIPISITTSPKGPYDDSFGSDGFLLYRYRGSDPQHHENVGLRKAFSTRTPLIYFHGVVPGKYLAVWPVYIIDDLPVKLAFKVAVDDMTYLDRIRAGPHDTGMVSYENTDSRRAYITSKVRQRLHQRGFRERVLSAYKDQCALCRLRHRELLDAAHIIPDSEPDGKPIVKNGIALCKLHHAAFDSFFIGIRPDFKVVVRPDVLDETDGPMLRYGLQELQHTRMLIPRKIDLRPNAGFLARRWERFVAIALKDNDEGVSQLT